MSLEGGKNPPPGPLPQGGGAGGPRVHIVIPTHTTRHLAASLAGIGCQTVRPASVVVSSDKDEPAIGALVQEGGPRVGCEVIYVSRPHKGFAHPGQVRNNGFRAIRQTVGMRDDDVVLGIDGDIVLAADAVERHAALARGGAELVLGFRICLSEAATAGVDARAILEGADLGTLASADEVESLSARQVRYEKNLVLRERCPSVLRPLFVKPHKPKLISAHYAVKASKLLEINGFDEEYREYGYEDDDLGRRLHAAGARCAIGVRDIRAYHLWHPTRAPKRPMDTPGYARFAMKGLPVRAVRGIENPMPQEEPVVRVVGASSKAAEQQGSKAAN